MLKILVYYKGRPLARFPPRRLDATDPGRLQTGTERGSDTLLERRNREQRTARELPIRHYKHPPPTRDQHSLFTRRVRGHRVRTKSDYRVNYERRKRTSMDRSEIR